MARGVAAHLKDCIEIDELRIYLVAAFAVLFPECRGALVKLLQVALDNLDIALELIYYLLNGTDCRGNLETLEIESRKMLSTSSTRSLGAQ